MRRKFLACVMTLLSPVSIAYENPFLRPGAAVADGKPGAFGQNNTGDCFFLAGLIAIAQDSHGQALLESALPRTEPAGRLVVFPNLPDRPVEISTEEHTDYRLTDENGDGESAPVLGDPDVGLLEIAADKLWKSTVKTEGLWDDVPMNALYMFSGAPQLLLWNRANASVEHRADIDKYRRLPDGIVTELPVTTVTEAERRLKSLLAADPDGISVILIDYVDYHAAAIVDIDFSAGKYRYINPHRSVLVEDDLQGLLDGLAGGYYALNYIELAPPPSRSGKDEGLYRAKAAESNTDG